MDDFTVKELSDLLVKLPKDARVSYSSGERNSLIIVTSKNGNKVWSITRSGKLE